jgi:hypothetical protein
MKLRKSFILAFALALVATIPLATLPTNKNAKIAEPLVNNVVINIPSFDLWGCHNQDIICHYKVTLGRKGIFTPEGMFRPKELIKMPSFRPVRDHELFKVAQFFPPGINNPMGTRAVCFYGHVYLHGLPPARNFKIGQVKNGACVGMRNQDIEKLFPLINKNTKIHIVYSMNYLVISSDGQPKIKKFKDIYQSNHKIIKDGNKTIQHASSFKLRIVEDLRSSTLKIQDPKINRLNL